MDASTEIEPVVSRWSGYGVRLVSPGVLLVLAAVGWWWSARMAQAMTMGTAPPTGMAAMGGTEIITVGAFMGAWLAMMTAMMFPAVTPVVKLYGRAAAAGRVAALPFFVAGYIVVWTSIGLPAYAAWRALMEPIQDGRAWAGRLAGLVVLSAAAWQLTPLKSVCLRHCRSPISFFMRSGTKAQRPAGALQMGATHGLLCLGCCWALMAVLIAFGTMNLAWMTGLAVLIFAEKNASAGEDVARLAAVAFVVVGVTLVLRPETLSLLT